MKWINLAERQPVGIATYVVLKIGDKRCFFSDINSIRGSGEGEEYHVDTYGWQEWVPKSNIEWLDETPPNFKFSAENPQIMSAFELHGKDCRGDLDKFKKFLQDYFPDETRWILAEQHRNTRHDAIETLHASFTRYVDDPNQTDFDFVRAASRDIHNLLIRRESWTNK